MGKYDINSLHTFAIGAVEYSRVEEFLESYTRHLFVECYEDITMERAKEIALANIGYCSGNATHREREMIEEAFDTEHPIFGRIKELGPPTTDEAFSCGIKQMKLKDLRNEQSEKDIQNKG